MKTSGFAITVAAVAILATSGFAQQGNGGPGGRGGGPGGNGGPNGRGMMQISALQVVTPPTTSMLERISSQLELTDDQYSQLTTITTKGETTIKTLTAKATKAAQTLQTALLATDYNATKVKELAVTAQKAEMDVITANIDVWTNIHAILSADQITLMKQLSNTRPGRGQGQGRGQDQNRGQGMGPDQGQMPQGPPPGGEDQMEPNQ